jgi:DNA repair exonuclease SbcCD ATPase subunit
MNLRPIHLLVLGLTLVVAAGCSSTYYAAWEKLGYHKRDILKERVVDARDEQAAASEQFKDALTRLKEVYTFDGGDLEKSYNQLQSQFDACQKRAETVRTRIRSMDTVANDLFAEWDKEIGQISNASMAASSRQQLQETRSRYTEMQSALKKAEASMDPILLQFRDYTLFLKHNLNAQAIASLKGESLSIQEEITRLIADMNASIAQADAFVETLR